MDFTLDIMFALALIQLRCDSIIYDSTKKDIKAIGYALDRDTPTPNMRPPPFAHLNKCHMNM